MESPSYLEFFLQHVPREFLRNVLVSVCDCYAAAQERCEADFDDSEAENVRPFYRRGLIEQSLRDVAKQTDGVTATVVRGAVGENGQLSWWHHTLVSCGPVTFTQNAVGAPTELVRPSLFRQEYATTNRQLRLFPEEADLGAAEMEAALKDMKLYGILLHGQSPEPNLPGFVVVRFPNHEYDAYLPGSIDLFRVFPEVVASRGKMLAGGTQVEQVAEPAPQLKAGRGAKGVGA